jgi:signal transduction histidine kinase
VDRAAYRIVQEALTNVARHADRAPTGIRLDYGADEVAVTVEDDGPAAPGGTVVPGTGLTGMRERVTALGGTLDTAPRPCGGFSVHARIPFQGHRAYSDGRGDLAGRAGPADPAAVEAL